MAFIDYNNVLETIKKLESGSKTLEDISQIEILKISKKKLEREYEKYNWWGYNEYGKLELKDLRELSSDYLINIMNVCIKNNQREKYETAAEILEERLGRKIMEEISIKRLENKLWDLIKDLEIYYKTIG